MHETSTFISIPSFISSISSYDSFDFKYFQNTYLQTGWSFKIFSHILVSFKRNPNTAIPSFISSISSYDSFDFKYFQNTYLQTGWSFKIFSHILVSFKRNPNTVTYIIPYHFIFVNIQFLFPPNHFS